MPSFITFICAAVVTLDFILSISGCNAKRSSENRRIYNGRETDIRDFPWMAHLIKNNKGFIDDCGGSILSEFYVLTAAHCYAKSFLDTVKYGSSRWDTLDGTLVPVQNVIKHPRFAYRRYSLYDIAIVEVAIAIEFSENAEPIALRKITTYPGEEAVVCGWGQYEEGEVPKILRQTTVNVLDLRECRRRAGNDPYIDRSKICTTHNTCYGDSGAPLVVGRAQIGIVSGKIPGGECGDTYYPALYTNVAVYRSFIDSITRRTTKWV